eukprot:366568-Chlamydomonas_euryale.AAC.6
MPPPICHPAERSKAAGRPSQAAESSDSLDDAHTRMRRGCVALVAGVEKTEHMWCAPRARFLSNVFLWGKACGSGSEAPH